MRRIQILDIRPQTWKPRSTNKSF